MRSWVSITPGEGPCRVSLPGAGNEQRPVAAGQPFGLDIEDPTDEIIDQLATSLGLHPLAVENSKQFGQRAKLQVYRNGALLVGYGFDDQLHEPIEVHCYCSTGFLITLRRAPSPALDAVRRAGLGLSRLPGKRPDPGRCIRIHNQLALHPVLRALPPAGSAAG